MSTINLIALILTTFHLQSMACDSPALIDYYSNLNESDLEQIFLKAPEPQSIPAGVAYGSHVITKHSVAKLPRLLKRVALKEWHAKSFEPYHGIVYDLLNKDRPLGHALSQLKLTSRAKLSIDSISHSLMRAGYKTPADLTGGERLAVITDYTEVDYGGSIKNYLMKDAKGWIDEFREVTRDLWIGRSFYKGKFWGYVVLTFDPNSWPCSY